MNHISRCFSLLLAVCFLGQSSFLAAQQLPEGSQYYSLKQYQEFAKEDLENTSWLNQKKDIIITAAGTTVTVGTLAAILMSYQKNKLEQASKAAITKEIAAAEQRTRKIMQEEMNSALEAAERQHLQRELAQQQDLRGQMELSNQAWQKKLNEYKSFHNQHMQAAFESGAESNMKVRTLEREVSTLKKRISYMERGKENLANQIKNQLRPAYRKNYLKANLLEDLLHDLQLDYMLANQASMSKIKPFLESFSAEGITLAQRKKMIEELLEQPFVKQMGTEAQQQEFKLLLEQTASVMEHQTLSTTGHVLSTRIASMRNRLGPKFLSEAHALYLKIFSKRNIFTMALILGIGLSASDMQAQNQARRISNNFSLFLNATEEELEILEKNPETKKACIMGAEALNLLTSMPQKEAEVFLNLIPSTIDAPSQKLMKNISAY